MGPGMFDSLGAFIRFALWATPILGAFAVWKIAEIAWWLFHHVTIN